MQLINLTVPLDWHLPISPDDTSLPFTPITRIATRDRSNAPTLPPGPRGGTTMRGGTGMPLRAVGADGSSAYAVGRKS